MENICDMYLYGLSIPQIAKQTGISRSTVRNKLLAFGVALRTRSDGIKQAAKDGRLGGGLRGKKRIFTKKHREAISLARVRWSEHNAIGMSVKPSGYAEYTTGPNKGRAVHLVVMEEHIGRKIKRGECVHHIDENKLNNCLDNLALMTLSAHAKLHRMMDAQRGIVRERDENGRFS